MKIVLQHLTKEFPGATKASPQKVIAVNDMDIEIPDGTLVALLGPSGCGKSTALNLISGLIKPTSGRVFFGDDDVTDLEPENRGIGMVFQNYALYPHLNALQNIIFPLQNFKGKDKLSKEQMTALATETAKLVQIDRILDHKPCQMSGGQQQRVAIARALVKRPKVLLLDEPLSNLDARLRLQTREEIRRIQRETGITTIFVTHDQEEAMSISDSMVLMKQGVVNQIGAPQEVYDKPINLFVAKFLGTPPINVFNGMVVGGKLFIGDSPVMDAKGISDREVYVGIRPEGFILDDGGSLVCDFDKVDVMGRDKMIVCRHSAMTGVNIRAIIPSENTIASCDTVSFSLKKSKVHIFDKQTEARLDTED